MSIELKEGWNGPFTLTVKGSAPKGVSQSGEGTQWKGKYPPHKDVLQWDVLFNELGSTKVTVCSPASPGNATYADAWIHVEPNKNKPEYPFRTMYTKEEKEQKSQGGGGGYKGGGMKAVYTTEQQATKDSLELAILSLKGGLIGNDNSIIPCSLAAIEKLQERFYARIMGAIPPKPETTQS